MHLLGYGAHCLRVLPLAIGPAAETLPQLSVSESGLGLHGILLAGGQLTAAAEKAQLAE